MPGIVLSNENYVVVVDRYGDAQTLVNSHYVQLITPKSAPYTSSPN